MLTPIFQHVLIFQLNSFQNETSHVRIWIMSHIELSFPYTRFRALLQLTKQLINLYLVLHDYLLEEFYPV